MLEKTKNNEKETVNDPLETKQQGLFHIKSSSTIGNENIRFYFKNEAKKGLDRVRTQETIRFYFTTLNNGLVRAILLLECFTSILRLTQEINEFYFRN